MSSFQFKEIDIEGHGTLQVIAEAHKLNQWLFDNLKPYCSGNIIEIGSGIGNISECCLQEGFQVTLSDVRVNYYEELKRKFNGFPNLKNIIKLDLEHPDFDN